MEGGTGMTVSRTQDQQSFPSKADSSRDAAVRLQPHYSPLPYLVPFRLPIAAGKAPPDELAGSTFEILDLTKVYLISRKGNGRVACSRGLLTPWTFWVMRVCEGLRDSRTSNCVPGVAKLTETFVANF